MEDLQTQKPLNKDVRLGMIEQQQRGSGGGGLDGAARTQRSQHGLGMVEVAQVLAVAGVLAIALLYHVHRRRRAQGRRGLVLPTVGAAARERAE